MRLAITLTQLTSGLIVKLLITVSPGKSIDPLHPVENCQKCFGSSYCSMKPSHLRHLTWGGDGTVSGGEPKSSCQSPLNALDLTTCFLGLTAIESK